MLQGYKATRLQVWYYMVLLVVASRPLGDLEPHWSQPVKTRRNVMQCFRRFQAALFSHVFPCLPMSSEPRILRFGFLFLLFLLFFLFLELLHLLLRMRLVQACANQSGHGVLRRRTLKVALESTGSTGRCTSRITGITRITLPEIHDQGWIVAIVLKSRMKVRCEQNLLALFKVVYATA